MKSLHAAWALLPDGFAANVRLRVADGLLAEVEPGVPAASGDEALGIVIPGMPDLHSHAFQRIFAGHTQHVDGGTDFWSWREAMYRAAAAMTPALYTPVMAWLCKELLKGGYTSLAEFHYLHHQPDGAAYAPPAAMAHSLAEGAALAGLPLTVLLTVYERGGFDGRELTGGQTRFAMSLDQAAGLADAVRQAGATTGLALHSLRAATPETVSRAASVFPAGPIHIHVAEQTAEVAECVATQGAPPVAWLLDHAQVDSRWCLVHATHATPPEIRAAATCGAVIGICPTTEADLGDGLFDLPEMLAAGGAFGVGSDSNTALDAFAELRLLEYGQRLGLRRRNVAARPGLRTGRALWQGAAAGGARACGRHAGVLAPGHAADLVVIEGAFESAGAPPGTVLDSAIFAATRPPARHVMAAGAWQVRDFRHVAEDQIDAAYAAALRALA